MAKAPFSGVDQFLREIFGENMRQEDLADKIGEKQGRYSSYLRGSQNLGAKTIHRYLKNIYDLGIIEGRKQNAQNFFKAIAAIHKYDNNANIWKKLITGKSDNSKSSNLSNYQSGKTTISQSQFENLLGKHSSRIFKPLIEFMECSPYRTSQKPNASWKLFKNDTDKEAYVKKELYEDDKITPKLGVYAMYDSSGRILYFGMAQYSNHGLHKEILQRLKAPVHRDVVLIRNGKFCHLGTVGKKPKPGAILVGDMTRYISAIEVSVPQAIPNIEAVVLRLIPNDTVNYKVENIEQ